MGKKTSKKDKAGRARYRDEGRASKNRQRKQDKAAQVLEFYQLRNSLMKKHELSKGDAKRAAKLISQGTEESEAVKASKQAGVPPTNK